MFLVRYYYGIGRSLQMKARLQFEQIVTAGSSTNVRNPAHAVQRHIFSPATQRNHLFETDVGGALISGSNYS